MHLNSAGLKFVMIVVSEVIVSSQKKLSEMIENFPVEFVFAVMARKLAVIVLAVLEDMIDK